MASGLPLITSNVHGINDYSQNGVTGFKCNPASIDEFADAILCLSENVDLRNKMSKNNITRSKQFDIKASNKNMIRIYREALNVK